jgi:hypothetical protein
LTVTETLPAERAEGAVHSICEAVEFEMRQADEPNVTLSIKLRPDPVMVTLYPPVISPEAGVRAVILTGIGVSSDGVHALKNKNAKSTTKW